VGTRLEEASSSYFVKLLLEIK